MKVSVQRFGLYLFDKRRLFVAAIIASLWSVVNPVLANVSHVVQNGKLIGANNVYIAGSFYDVRFVDGVFDVSDSRLISDSRFVLSQKLNGYREAAQALQDQVFVDLDAGPRRFDSDPYLTSGCRLNSLSLCRVHMPTNEVYEGEVVNYIFTNVRPSGAAVDTITIVTVPFGFSTGRFRNEDGLWDVRDADTWAVWSTSTVAAIPEPETCALALAGLGVVGWMARRRRV